MSDACPSDMIDLANRLADASGPVIRKYFRTPIRIDGKADSSPVTAADREAEQACIKAMHWQAHHQLTFCGREP